MPKGKAASSSDSNSQLRPPTSLEAQENLMISLAVQCAEKQLRDGTASSQVITHYLKLGSSKERIEKEILEKQKELIEAKTKNLNSNSEAKELYNKALEAFRRYSGAGGEDDESIAASPNGALIMEFFENFIKTAYGEKSDDGRRFMKSEEISRSFMETPAYEVLFEKLVTDAGAASEFVNRVMRANGNKQAAPIASN